MSTHKTVTPRKVYKIRLKVGDEIIVRSGKHKGKVSKVTAVHPLLNKVTVEGVNVVKKHLKRSELNPKGGTKEITRPIWISKVGLYDKTAKKAVRIGYKLDKSGKKRVNQSTGKEVK